MFFESSTGRWVILPQAVEKNKKKHFTKPFSQPDAPHCILVCHQSTAYVLSSHHTFPVSPYFLTFPMAGRGHQSNFFPIGYLTSSSFFQSAPSSRSLCSSMPLTRSWNKCVSSSSPLGPNDLLRLHLCSITEAFPLTFTNHK